MTVHLDWPEDVVARLTEEARTRGLSLDDYLLQTVLQKTSNGTITSEDPRRQARLQAVARIREIRKGVTLGPDLSIRDLIDEGRRF